MVQISGRTVKIEKLTEVLAVAAMEKQEVVAIVPRMLAYFADMPRRYEVTHVDVFVRKDGG